ncbi:TNT domain-containing protein [Amycolatopsis lurida]
MTQPHELHQGLAGRAWLQAFATYKDEEFQVAGFTAPHFLLSWSKDDAERAAELGIPEGEAGGYIDKATPEQLTALWQVRIDVNGTTVPPVQPLSEDERGKLLIGIGRALVPLRPENGTVTVDFRQLGGYTEIEVSSTGENGTLFWSAPPEVGELLTELRAGMYEKGVGAWLQARYTLRGNQFDFDFDLLSPPEWKRPPDRPGLPTRTAFAKELEEFPRDDEHLPRWLREKAGLPLAVTFQHARIVDSYIPGERPVVDRPALPEAEIPAVLHYLERSPVVLIGDQPGPDIFAPDAEPDVPERYHTDGRWIWHASAAHYLRKHGTPPDPELVEHIRAQRYQTPHVDRLHRLTAAADLLGEPRPKPDPDQFEPSTGDLAAELETQVGPELDGTEVLVALRARLDEAGAWPNAYRLGGSADDAWSLKHTEQGWEVARYQDGEPVDPCYFTRVESAAQQLLGAVLLHPARITAGAESPLETARELADWPIQPVPGEPPLTLLRNKRLIRLAAGTVVVRFGDERGNLVHHTGVRFPTTSLPLERESAERRYRLARPLYVITGITVPWANLPGGAIAYVLPRTITEHTSDGSLEGTV